MNEQTVKLVNFRQKALGPGFKLFLLKKLPLALIAGVKVKLFTDNKTETLLRFSWINQNPFKSMYFAAMQMAAELSTGLILYQYLSAGSNFSMLLIKIEADYTKKAVGIIRFECNSGLQVGELIKTLHTTDTLNIDLPVKAINEQGEEVANFTFRWSLKNRQTQS